MLQAPCDFRLCCRPPVHQHWPSSTEVRQPFSSTCTPGQTKQHCMSQTNALSPESPCRLWYGMWISQFNPMQAVRAPRYHRKAAAEVSTL